MPHHRKKINHVTFSIQKFSFPNKADIESKTFLEVICTRTPEHRIWGEIFVEAADRVGDGCTGVGV